MVKREGEVYRLSKRDNVIRRKKDSDEYLLERVGGERVTRLTCLMMEARRMVSITAGDMYFQHARKKLLGLLPIISSMSSLNLRGAQRSEAGTS